MPRRSNRKSNAARKMQRSYRKYRKRRYPMRKNVTLHPNNSVTVSLRKTGEITQSSEFQTNGIKFKLNEFNSYGKFTQIFDQFRILKIIQKIYPQCDSFSAPTNISIAGESDEQQVTQPSPPLCLYKIDRDDVEVPSSLDDALKNPRFKVRNAKKPITIAFKPNSLNNIYEGAVTNNYSISYNDWLNSENSSDNEYYGLVRAFHCTGVSGVFPLKYRIITTAVVQFKGLRLDE